MMKIVDDLIKVIDSYTPDYSKKPSEIKLIIGEVGYNGFCDNEKYCINTKIEYYKEFKEVAFILDDWSLAGSELFVLSILLNSIDNAVYFLTRISTINNAYSKFIEYLYYDKGIILINRKGKAKKFKIFENENVTCVLNVGCAPCETIIKHLKKCADLPKVSFCIHCSTRNMGTSFEEHFKTWFLKDDSMLKKVDDLFDNVSFSDFIIV